MSKPILWIVIPCYNEEQVLPITAPLFLKKINDLSAAGLVSEKSRVLFVNDGSKDKTWEIISRLHEENPLFCGVCLSRNKGHQNALLAGLMTAMPLCDMAISLDADLQDDTQAIPQMIDKYYEGCDIVYGVRSGRKTDSFFKRTTAQGFYKFMKGMGVKTVYNHADFRLMSARAMAQLGNYEERNMFLRGIVPLIGYKTDCVYYERKERLAGESKYPLKKMLSFAFDGITSFSIKPITLISAVGILIIVVSIIAAIYSLISYFCGNTTPGWTSLILSIWFLGGVQLVSVGQYIGKIYVESKHRPRYNPEIFLSDETRAEETK